MFWPADKRFARCPGKNQAFLKEREAGGDYSHSDKNHTCDECRCKKRAGQGTKGDFYGLGVETGHLGVGWCSSHDKRMPTHAVLKFADDQLKKIQQVGDLQMDSQAHLQVMNDEAKVAELSLRARQDLELVVDTLNDFKKTMNVINREENESVPILRDILARIDVLDPHDEEGAKVLRKDLIDAILERTCLTEMSQGRPIAMTDATRIKLSLDIAKSLSKVKLDHFKLDSSSYIHYDELKVRIPRMLTLASNLFEELNEMVIAKEENAVERINEKWVKGLADVWSDVKTGAQD